MKRTFGLALMALVLSSTLGCAQLFDDFSGGGWKRFSTTPGTLTVKRGSMHLQDGLAPPNWVTASKVFTVDFDKTPFFVTKVGAMSDS
ncbi:MAG: hypothetical protein KAI66_12715, partial [Lentisphaeria bacterium]|nr:hypothetical protein [Lentisphaeria bacterium]